ncbi:hypothetical protein ASD44_06060 [Mesorhizobium sp. Root554]|uniref:DUF1697 domain-containing protein n=1 Tax=unclassified Mesorhizobium TaxID=325217 RepID=UPI0006F77C9A|nr:MULTISPECIES: DUF1697 domain-containing protein [unclassified Mesorhizobium]KQZ15838.1 hypothetical protein ASD27_06065 [Mesorhizobium sp. Root1471]KQZ38349.1 hypothetical protein ASD44_06060 [Mesorhizobium sp. Root554]
MPTYVALLYSIVLTPQRRVVMADLKDMAVSLGLRNPRTLAATGNLVFEAENTPVAKLEASLEIAFKKTFGRHVDIVVRPADAWKKLAQGNPFPAESLATPAQVAVRVMRKPVPDEVENQLKAAVAPDEKLRIVGGDIWLFFSRATPNSRLLTASNHKRFGVGTSRNWNTVRKLAEMVTG